MAEAEKTVYAQPGALIQKFEFSDLTLVLTLQYANNRTALVSTYISNKSAVSKHLQLSWQGGLLNQWDDKRSVPQALPGWSRELTSNESGLTIHFGKVRDTWNILTSGSSAYKISRSLKTKTAITPDTLSYQAIAPITLAAKQTYALYTTHSYVHNQQEAEQQQVLSAQILDNPEHYINAAKQRWQSYISQGLKQEQAPVEQQ
ncbi:hypothetical protein A9Q98_09465 [Thalassotalea sp. 42_200_T64]|nr:hypothetical protein A9Q98_09465 [Thalassotalea sp. 42_200_T64]